MGVLIPAITTQIYSKFSVGLALICFIYIVDTLLMGSGSFQLGITIYYTDIVLVLVAIAAVLRLLFAKEFPLRHPAWLIICAIFFVNLAIGLPTNGTSAGVQARGDFYALAVALYAMSFKIDEKKLQQVFNGLALTAFIFIGLAVYRWVVFYTPITSLLPEGGVYNIDGPMRVIYSDGALVIAQILLAGLFYSELARGFAITKYISYVLLVSLLALQHRSVWLATIVGVLARFIIGKSKNNNKGKQLLMLAGVILLIITPLLMSDKLSGVTQQVSSSAERGIKGEDTGQARIDNWKATIYKWWGDGVKTILIGPAFGGDKTRIVEGSNGKSIEITFGTHNQYVEMLTSYGLTGLIAFLWVTLHMLIGLYKLLVNRVNESVTEYLLVVLIMQYTFYVAYGWNYMQTMLFGVAISYIAVNTINVSNLNTNSPNIKAKVNVK
jgi:O-Antigen ligase